MEHDTDQPVVTVFRSRLRDDAEANGYGKLAARMEARARQMPGFVDFKTFVASDGERVSLVTFDTVAHHEGWREDPEHRSAQQRGRDDFYLEYTISVCSELRRRHFDTPEVRRIEATS
jgi:heme-degrading monooxygenase HmoA